MKLLYILLAALFGQVCHCAVELATLLSANTYTAANMEITASQAHYILSQPFDLGANVILRGIGASPPIIECNQSNFTGITSGLSGLGSIKNISISNLIITGCFDGMNLGSSTQNCVLSNLEFCLNSQVGLYINCVSSTVTNVVARYNGQTGIYANVGNISFVNCTANNNTDDGFNLNNGPSFISVVGCTASYNGGDGIISSVSNFTVNDSVAVGNAGNGIFLAFFGSPVVIHNTVLKDNIGAGLQSGGATTIFDSCICDNAVPLDNVICDGLGDSISLSVQNTAATGIQDTCVPLSGTFIDCTTAANTAICKFPSWYPRPLQASPSCSQLKTTTGSINSGNATGSNTVAATTGSNNSGNTSFAATTAASNRTTTGHSASSTNYGTKIEFPRIMLILISLAGFANFA